MRLPYHRIHLVGAGGAGMSAIARVLAGLGHEVSGSDLRGGSSLDGLRDVGVATYTGHHPEVASSAELVVASSAVPDRDPEIRAAIEAGIPVWRRPQLLEALSSGVTTIGATGTHGKTTTTALLVTALRAAGEDPSFIVGGDLAAWNTNGHHGASELLVVEADEAFRTFEHIRLDGLVVTNVEVDHLEHFGSEEEIMGSFLTVAAGVTGPVVACSDDPGSRRLAGEVGAATYGIDPDAVWRIRGHTMTPAGSSFDLVGPAGTIPVRVSRPGMHVIRNAAGALALLGTMGYDLDAAASGLASFRGVGRRFEHRGTVGGVTLIDDYAHHPSELAVTLEAARASAEGRLWAVFQPHLYSRTERFKEDFGQVLTAADEVVVTDVYGSREEPVPGVTGEIVAEAARRRGASVHYVAHLADLAGYLAERVAPGDLVVTMGAGDITIVPTELAMRLAER